VLLLRLLPLQRLPYVLGRGVLLRSPLSPVQQAAQKLRASTSRSSSGHRICHNIRGGCIGRELYLCPPGTA